MNVSRFATLFGLTLGLGVLFSSPLKLNAKSLPNPISLYITGRITVISTPVSGVDVKLFTSSTSEVAHTRTDAQGNYRFNVNSNGTYIVEPSSSAYSFRPSQIIVNVNGRPVLGQNFRAIPAVPTDKFSSLLKSN